MNHFEIFALGESFSPDAFLASTAMKFDSVWHRGDQGNDHPKSSGVCKILGDGQSLSVFEQERIAILFLKENRDVLKSLAIFPGVSSFTLGLQYHVELAINTVGFCMGPSSSLMWHALDIGFEPTYYVTLDRKREQDG